MLHRFICSCVSHVDRLRIPCVTRGPKASLVIIIILFFFFHLRSVHLPAFGFLLSLVFASSLFFFFFGILDRFVTRLLPPDHQIVREDGVDGAVGGEDLVEEVEAAIEPPDRGGDLHPRVAEPEEVLFDQKLELGGMEEVVPFLLPFHALFRTEVNLRSGRVSVRFRTQLADWTKVWRLGAVEFTEVVVRENGLCDLEPVDVLDADCPEFILATQVAEPSGLFVGSRTGQGELDHFTRNLAGHPGGLALFIDPVAPVGVWIEEITTKEHRAGLIKVAWPLCNEALVVPELFGGNVAGSTRGIDVVLVLGTHVVIEEIVQEILDGDRGQFDRLLAVRVKVVWKIRGPRTRC